MGGVALGFVIQTAADSPLQAMFLRKVVVPQLKQCTSMLAAGERVAGYLINLTYCIAAQSVRMGHVSVPDFSDVKRETSGAQNIIHNK